METLQLRSGSPPDPTVKMFLDNVLLGNESREV